MRAALRRDEGVAVMADALFEEALERLKVDHVERFMPAIRKGRRVFAGGFEEEIFLWPEGLDDEVIVDVHQSSGVQEPFHHHDYFYFNYAYRGSYTSVIGRDGSSIVIREGEMFAGQPFTGHAICVHDDATVDMIAVCIQKEALFKTYLPLVLNNERLFSFFVHVERNETSEEYIHMSFADDGNVLRVLKMMVIEYAYRRRDTPAMMRALTHLFLMQISRQLALQRDALCDESDVSRKILHFVIDNLPSVTLESVARRFSYHPNYVSDLLRKSFGKTFSDLVSEQKMDRAVRMLEGTTLSVEEIAADLGYASKSSFYKAFKKRFGATPRSFRAAG